MEQQVMSDVGRQRLEFLESRRRGIGGSDIATLLGFGAPGSTRTALDIWASKIHAVNPAEVSSESPWGPAARGRALEPIILDLYGVATGREFRPNPGMVRDEQHPELIANVDAEVVEPDSDDLIGVEAKSPGFRVLAETLARGVPRHYYLQMQHYMGVRGYRRMAFVVLDIERWKLIHLDVERDEGVIAMSREFAVDWWQRHVVGGEPPTLDTPEVEIAVPEVGELVKVQDCQALEDALEEWRNSREIAAAAKELMSAADDQVRVAMMALKAERVDFRGSKIYTTQQAGARRLDTKALLALRPLVRSKVETLLMEEFGVQATELPALLGPAEMPLPTLYRTGEPTRPLRVYLRRSSPDE